MCPSRSARSSIRVTDSIAEAFNRITRWLVSFLLRRTCSSRLTRSTSQRRVCFTSTGRIDVLAATIAAQWTCSHSGFEAATSNRRRRSLEVHGSGPRRGPPDHHSLVRSRAFWNSAGMLHASEQIHPGPPPGGIPLPQTGVVSGLPLGTSMNTSTRVGPSVRADPCVEWTTPAGSKNVFPAGTTCSGSSLMANASCPSAT
jgi:hypothetical protein